MSAVLKALQKIERRRAQTDRMVVTQWPVDPLAITRPRKHIGKTIGVALAVIICIGLIVALVRQRHALIPVAPSETPAVAHREPTSPAGDNLTSTGAPVNLPRSMPTKAAQTIPLAAEPSPSDAVTPPAGPRPKPIQATPPRASAPSPPQPVAAAPLKAVAPPDSPTPLPAQPVIERLIDPAITLQAVVWSDNPDECMAVINDRIMHTGDRIERYTLVKISANEVWLTDNGQTWRLPFMKR